MIILHRGTDAHGTEHIGYAIRRNGACYIIDLQGREFRVIGNTVVPIFDEDTEYKLENYPDVFTRTTIYDLHNRNIHTIKDLLGMTDQEIKGLYGVGPSRFEKIMNLLSNYRTPEDEAVDM